MSEPTQDHVAAAIAAVKCQAAIAEALTRLEYKPHWINSVDGRIEAIQARLNYVRQLVQTLGKT